MFKNRAYVILIINAILAIAMSSCENKKMSFREIRISAAPYINTGSIDLTGASLNIEPDPAGVYKLEVIIYSYSQGKETISMKGDKGFVTETGTARIKVLVKITEGEKIVKSEFLEIPGNTNDEILRNLQKSVEGLVRN